MGLPLSPSSPPHFRLAWVFFPGDVILVFAMELGKYMLYSALLLFTTTKGFQVSQLEIVVYWGKAEGFIEVEADSCRYGKMVIWESFWNPLQSTPSKMKAVLISFCR